MKAILCRPKFDEPTEHSFAFAGEILRWCRQVGIDIIDLAEDDAVRPAVEKALQTFNPDIFVFYDHGSEEVGYTTDALAEFQEAFNCGFHYRFIEGDSRQNSLQRAKGTFSRLALELVDVGNPFAAICMREDGDSLVYYNAHGPEEKEGCLLAFLKLPVKAFTRT
jgi:hypothetical protein